ncbi:MAG: hypothetical protein NPIRA05_21090 [Nitrospirales bacterium]|nr:MAG: hypothetical protein NPIRA05_21090 [Nitrospirales bacterium]
MRKVNRPFQEDGHEALSKLIPARKRSDVLNEALRQEMLHRQRELAAARIKQLRKRSATLTGHEIMKAIRNDRSKSAA